MYIQRKKYIINKIAIFTCYIGENCLKLRIDPPALLILVKKLVSIYFIYLTFIICRTVCFSNPIHLSTLSS